MVWSCTKTLTSEMAGTCWILSSSSLGEFGELFVAIIHSVCSGKAAVVCLPVHTSRRYTVICAPLHTCNTLMPSLSLSLFICNLFATLLCFPPLCRPQFVQCGSGDDHQRRWFQWTVWRQTWGVWRQGPPSLSCPSSPSPCLRSSQWVNV